MKRSVAVALRKKAEVLIGKECNNEMEIEEILVLPKATTSFAEYFEVYNQFGWENMAIAIPDLMEVDLFVFFKNSSTQGAEFSVNDGIGLYSRWDDFQKEFPDLYKLVG